MRLKEHLWNVLHQLEHNEHHITLNLFGRELHPCARCSGTFLGIILSLPLILYISFNYSFNFEFIFILSFFLASFAIIDWGTAKAGIRAGTNSIRVISGFLLGIGSIVYLFLLPTNIFLNGISLWSYGIVFTVVAYAVWCRQYGLSLRNPIAENVAVLSAVPLTIASVPCGCSQTGGCCNSCALPGCSTTCCCGPWMVCCCTLPLMCFLPKILDWFKGRNKPKGGKTK